ncbi:MAG: hypothetical protein CL484_02395 [Acidobacteria bacterium]|nr:hypothetical protein [Acidobacteriota bacterium]
MGLRSFHLVFIVASILLSVMMGAWGGVTYGTVRGTPWHLVTVVGALLVAGLLSVYLVKFIQKTRELGLD